VLPVEHPDHFAFLDREHPDGRDCGCRRYAIGLSGQTTLAQEIARAQNRDYRFFPRSADNRELDAPFLKIHHMLRGIALAKNRFSRSKLAHRSSQTGRFKKPVHIKRR
jgi:hypothetical protein